jgi:HSP20 family protein
MAIDRRRTSGYLPLRDAIDRLFADSVIAPHLMGGQAWMPSTDMHATDNEVVLSMSIPGANPDDIHISVTPEAVTVSGEIKHSEHRTMGQSGTQQKSSREQKPGHTYVEEIWKGSFQRSFSLPTQIDPDKADANYENGILTLRLPKSEATRPRKISVQQQKTLEGQTKGTVQKETVPVRTK